jgi:hypothetical protein
VDDRAPMKEYALFLSSEETGFKIVKINATEYEFTGTVLNLVNGNQIVGQFLATKVVGIVLSENLA